MKCFNVSRIGNWKWKQTNQLLVTCWFHFRSRSRGTPLGIAHSTSPLYITAACFTVCRYVVAGILAEGRRGNRRQCWQQLHHIEWRQSDHQPGQVVRLRQLHLWRLEHCRTTSWRAGHANRLRSVSTRSVQRVAHYHRAQCSWHELLYAVWFLCYSMHNYVCVCTGKYDWLIE